MVRIVAVVVLLCGAALAHPTEEHLNLRAIVEEVNSATDVTWTAGHNYHPDTPLSYFKRLMGVKKNPKGKTLKVKTYDDVSSVPTTFDAREEFPKCKKVISHIRDQGDCGSCWAVAAAGTYSDRVCIASNGTFTTALSSEEVLSCCSYCGDGCDGGYPDEAWSFFVKTGLVTGGDYHSNIGCQPYTLEACEHHVAGKRKNCSSLATPSTPACKSKCYNKLYHKNTFEKDHHIASESYTFSSVADAQKDIVLRGSVEAAFDVYSDFLTYKSGVYTHKTGSYLGGHAVRVIGWGVENKTKYWLVANSWNTDWGDNGTFKIKRGTNECGFESDLVAGTI